jgi:hypothetical protein
MATSNEQTGGNKTVPQFSEQQLDQQFKLQAKIFKEDLDIFYK